MDQEIIPLDKSDPWYSYGELVVSIDIVLESMELFFGNYLGVMREFREDTIGDE